MPSDLTPAPASDSAVTAVSDCWNQIGVYGNNTCPKLQQAVHCRNCPVYSAAGVQLLDRPLPTGYRKEWAVHFAQGKPPRETGAISAVVFRLDQEWLALPTQAFQEVAERRPIHSLPHRRRGSLLGLVNLRGELLLAVSLGHLLALQNLPTPAELRTNYHRLLVTAWDGNRFAFPVDEVHGPQRFESHDLKTPPATVARAQLAHTQGLLFWEQRAVGLFDVVALFSTLNQSLA
jgi:chemotaxis-related protein WspD